jgi:aspartyl-tRNA(Asn)/glutamyl-tRNA(Gln) amidotransferase subunit A
MTTTTNATAPPSTGTAAIPLTISDAATALRAGQLTAVALTEAMISRADLLDETIGCYLVRTDDRALEAAAATDAALAAGNPVGPLAGIPLGIKDIIATTGAPTTAQSLVLDPGFGARGDAPVVARLRAAGAVITGKVTTMEYAIGCPDPGKPFPIPRNPWGTDYWTGGSSSGTGNGIAAGLFLGGLGTDTGGSVRLPASWCGISGLKQTFGRVPKSGCVPLGYSYDNIGPMARSARDCAIMLAVMAGHDESDACSVDVPVDDYLAALDGDVSGLRIGVVAGLADVPGGDPETGTLFAAAVQALAVAGAQIREVPLPYWEEVKTATMVGLTAEAFAYHHKDLQSRWTDYGAPTRIAIAGSLMATAVDYVQAQRVRRAAVRAVHELFGTVDVVLHPTCAGPAPLLEKLEFKELIDSIHTQYWNGVGFPAISVPMGLTAAGLPVGLHIAGRPFEEGTVLKVADTYQQLTDHHLAVAPMARSES